MKQIFSILILFFSVDAMSMSRVLQPTKIAPKTMHGYLQKPRNFGVTHFILGYKKPALLAQSLPIEVTEKKQTKLVLDTKPLIMAGGSAHLIDKTRRIQPFFSLIHDITSIILAVLAQAEKDIKIAAFSLTDGRIASELLAAHKRGIDVCIILDAGNMKQPYSKGQKLVDNGIPVWCYNPSLRPNYKKRNGYEPLMHHKCIIVDDILIIGSANSTRAAQRDNIENINIVRDPETEEEYRKEFERLKTYCVKCKLQVTA